MGKMMIDLLDCHKMFLTPHLRKGGIAADFTMGNGHDTAWLSKAVYGGEDAPGRVYAFDVQPHALESTAARLKEEECPDNCELILSSHSEAKKYIKEPICAGIFNLGWLPGTEKVLTTRRETTLPAVADAIEMLESGGGLIVAVYPGHEEGRLEGEELTEMLSGYSRFKVCVSKFRIINSPTSPFFFLIEKK